MGNIISVFWCVFGRTGQSVFIAFSHCNSNSIAMRLVHVDDLLLNVILLDKL